MHDIDLPEGWGVETGSLDLIEELVALLNAVSQAEIGRNDTTAESMRSMLTDPVVELQRDVRLARAPDGSPAALAWMRTRRPFVTTNGFGAVHPDWCGRGIGTALVRWASDRAERLVLEAPDDARIVVRLWSYADHAASQELLAHEGFEPVRAFLEMSIRFDGPPPPATFPEGIVVAPFRADVDDTPTALAHEEAFRDHFGHVPVSDAEATEWIRHGLFEDGTDTGLWWVAWDGDEIVGYLLGWPRDDPEPELGYVGVLGVRRPWRGRGLGRALLLHAFAEFHRRGSKGVALNVDAESFTGATRLYESVGMTPRMKMIVRERELRPGRNLEATGVE